MDVASFKVILHFRRERRALLVLIDTGDIGVAGFQTRQSVVDPWKFTIIDGVDNFQVLYGVDTDLPPDMSINEWTTADAISPETSICLQSQFRCEAEGLLGSITTGIPISIQIGLLVSSPEGVGSNLDTQTFTVLDVAVPAANDYLIRKLYTTTITLRNLTI